MTSRNFQLYFIAGMILLCSSAMGQVTIPEIWVDAWLDTAEEVTVVVLPDGSGDTFDQARTTGGGKVDATIYARLFGEDVPIPNFPGEDMWLESRLGGLVSCQGGSIADQDTDSEGVTYWRCPLKASGMVDPGIGDELIILVNGLDFEISVLGQITVVSPDLNFDGVVNLADVGRFVADYTLSAGGYVQTRSDFSGDGVMNIADVGIMATSVGADCP